jgi:hypothetical protein
MEGEKAKLVKYFNYCYGATNKSPEHRFAEIDALFDKSVVFVTYKEKFYFEQHQQSTRDLLAEGSKVEILRMEVRDPGIFFEDNVYLIQ